MTHSAAPGSGEQTAQALAEALDMIDTLCTGLEWNIEHHPTVMNGADEEALDTARKLLAKHAAYRKNTA